jgi:putative transposase
VSTVDTSLVSRQAHERTHPDGHTGESESLGMGVQGYHVVFIPKCRRKTLYAELRRYLGEVFRKLAQQKESRIEEGHLLSDHVHMLIAIPPKYAVAQVVGFIKGKSAIHLARVYGERKRNFVGQHFWARGYFVSTVGRDERVIREYIRKQEQEDARLDQLGLWR